MCWHIPNPTTRARRDRRRRHRHRRCRRPRVPAASPRRALYVRVTIFGNVCLSLFGKRKAKILIVYRRRRTRRRRRGRVASAFAQTPYRIRVRVVLLFCFVCFFAELEHRAGKTGDESTVTDHRRSWRRHRRRCRRRCGLARFLCLLFRHHR